MQKSKVKSQKRDRRHMKIRAKISGTAERPRLAVFKSNTGMYAQLIDDTLDVTLASSSGKDAAEVGREIAEKAKEKKVGQAVFDRGGYIYAGKVRDLADAARKAGLKF